mgnify:CR=1 FL=1
MISRIHQAQKLDDLAGETIQVTLTNTETYYIHFLHLLFQKFECEAIQHSFLYLFQRDFFRLDCPRLVIFVEKLYLLDSHTLYRFTFKFLEEEV